MTHKLLFTIPQKGVSIEAAKLENWRPIDALQCIKVALIKSNKNRSASNSEENKEDLLRTTGTNLKHKRTESEIVCQKYLSLSDFDSHL